MMKYWLFPSLADDALSLVFFATGHYARTEPDAKSGR
jgi:hypothetical protein